MDKKKAPVSNSNTAVEIRPVILENSDALVFTVDFQGKVLFVNDLCSKFTGYEPIEVTGRNLGDFILRDDRPLWSALVQRALDEGLPGIGNDAGEQEIRLVHEEAGVIWVGCKLFPMSRGRRAMNTLSGFMRDLTQEKQRVADLESTFEELWRAFEDTRLEIFRIDRHCTIISLEDQVENILGYESSHVDGKKLDAAGLVSQPDLQELITAFQCAAQHHSDLLKSITVRKKNGTTANLQVRVRYDRNTGHLEGIFYVLADAGRLRRIQEDLRVGELKYRLLAENVTDVIWTQDNEGRFTYLSPSVRSLIGYSVEEAMQLIPLEALSHSSRELAQHTEEQRRQLFERIGPADGTDSLTQEYELVRKDRSRIWTETATTLLRDARGRKVGVLGVTRDITERKQAEQRLQLLYEQEKELRQQIEREMSKRIEFTRALAHELKTPLTPILASVDSLLSQLHQEPQISLASNISRGAETLRRRIDELLDLAKGEIGMLQLELEWIDLLPILRDSAQSITPVSARQGQSLLLQLPPSLPLVRADAGRIQQVLLNLLQNAIKFTPRDGKIKLRAKEQDYAVIVEVHNTGPGLDKEEQNRIFEPYHRLPKKQSNEQLGGLGLGLALCKTLLDLHGGKIWSRSRPGKGTTFGFTLPLQLDGSRPSSPERIAKLWNILVIEDDRETLDSIVLAFAMDWPEANVLATRMGEEGLDLIESENPDMVILDLALPDMDGFEVLKQIRLFSPVPIVVLTVSNEEACIIKSFELGADDHISKPYRKRELISRLKAQLRKRTATDGASPIICGTLRLDPTTFELDHGGRQVNLTVVEGRILKHLMRNAGHVNPYSSIMETVWGEDHAEAIENLRVYISYLRRKLETDPAQPKLIRTKAGVGYWLAKPE